MCIKSHNRLLPRHGANFFFFVCRPVGTYVSDRLGDGCGPSMFMVRKTNFFIRTGEEHEKSKSINASRHSMPPGRDLIIIISVGPCCQPELREPWAEFCLLIYELVLLGPTSCRFCRVLCVYSRLGKQSVSLYILATGLRPMSKKR